LADRLVAAARKRAIGSSNGQDYTGDYGEEESVENEQESVDEESSHDSEEDEAALGEHGKIFSAAEFRVMAKYIARHKPEEWATMTSKQRWFPFYEEVTRFDVLSDNEDIGNLMISFVAPSSFRQGVW
jgi:hypothetical protein